MRRAILAMALAGTFIAPASATIYLSDSNGVGRLSGIFEPGDENAFATFLARPRERKLRVIYLDSTGGSIAAGIRIGRMIRKAGIATAVDADAARCDSACTLIFAGGVTRHYIGGDRVFEGFSARGGLGFHPAHLRDPAWTRAEFSQKGTDTMAAHYRAMGAPRTIELMQHAGFTSMFRPSGKTALDVRIATSLTAPNP
ncbi:MAG: hypothetical protein LCH61_07150 [Proteobacteria bacterium]|nr:hypothetical protein [Pseudomonadota bacterium]